MPSWTVRALAGMLLLLLTALVATAVLLEDGRERLVQAATPWRTDSELTIEHRRVASAAEELAVAFLSVDHRDMEPLVDAVLAGSTGGFAEEYAAQRDQLVEGARRARAVSVAEVVAVGVSELDDDSATVLVAADTTVQNRSTGDDSTAHHYRLRLDLVREAGRWLTSDVEFVR